MVTIKVGKPNVKVYINRTDGIFGSGGVREAYTDSKGIAYINWDDFKPGFQGEIVVNANSVYKGRIDINGVYSV
jgi:hypothetical protein